MNIKRLTIENFKRIGVVDITPDQKVMMITGKNGHGKTSTLDGIWAGLSNPRISEIPKPIKDGEEKAIITIDLVKYLVKRTFVEKEGKMTTRLTVTGAEGAEFKSPQKLLDKLLGGLTFDPLSFTRMKEKDQVELLLKLAGSEIDIEAMDAARENAYTQRTAVNQSVSTLSAARGEEPPQVVKIDISEIQKQMETSSNLRRDMLDQSNKLKNKKDKIIELNNMIKEIENDVIVIDKYLTEAETALAKYKPYDELKASIDEAVENNAKCGDWDKWAEAGKDIVVYSNKANEYTSKINEIDEKKKKAIEAIKFPYEGLSFGEGGVVYNNIPIKQASKAEQIRISMAIAMAMNPEIRVLRIEDGSLLDEDNLKLIHELAEENDYQVWIESVGNGEVGIVLEDGMIKDA
ncbi:MAG: AAA family ATPase [Candidatus Neomarinimicrobiota bacterium]